LEAEARSSEVITIIFEWHLGSVVELGLHVGNLLSIDLNLSWSENRGLNERKGSISTKLRKLEFVQTRKDQIWMNLEYEMKLTQ